MTIYHPYSSLGFIFNFTVIFITKVKNESVVSLLKLLYVGFSLTVLNYTRTFIYRLEARNISNSKTP